MNRLPKRRALPLLLFFALLIVSVAILIPVAVSADPEPAEIQDFSWQKLSALDISSNAPTELRFLFTISEDKLHDYDEVGFVFSKTNPVPSVNGSSCFKKTTDKVYRSVTADGHTESAPDGRYWVAVKMTNIPHSYFDGPIYVSAFVTDSDGTRYSDAEVITVCSADGHVHTVSNPDYTVPASVISNQKKVGHCAGCNLDNVVQVTGTTFTPSKMKFKKSGTEGEGYSKESFDPCVTMNTVRNGDVFHPTNEYPDGKDFYFEVDILWNSTMLNIPDKELIRFVFWNSDRNGDDKNHYNALFTFTPKNNSADSNLYCLHAGGFDYSSDISLLDGPEAGYQKAWDQYPNLSSSSSEMQYGWHRLAVRVHQGASIEEGKVVYSGISYLYIDGVLRWKIELDMSQLAAKDNLLFIATINSEDPTKLDYEDNTDAKRYFDFWTKDIQNATTEVDMVFRPASARLVDPNNFDTGVMPVYDPPAVPDYTLQNGSPTCAKVYFTEKTTVNLFDSKNPAGHPYYDSETNAFVVSKSLADIQGEEHFYPTQEHPGGQDLFFEYSMYWNPSLANWSNAGGKAEAKAIVFRHDPNNQTTQEPYLFYTKDGQSSDCPFAGHFDFSGMAPSSWKCVLEGDMYSGYAPGKYSRQDVLNTDSPSIGGYGWHRIGIRVHQEATINAGNVKYSGWTELYIDGSKVWKIGLNVDNAHSRGYELFNADIDPENPSELVYRDNDSAYPTLVQMRFENFVYANDDIVYFAIDDPIWSIGDDGFVHPTTRFGN